MMKLKDIDSAKDNTSEGTNKTSETTKEEINRTSETTKEERKMVLIVPLPVRGKHQIL